MTAAFPASRRTPSSAPNVCFQTRCAGPVLVKGSRVLPGRASRRIVRSQTMQEDAVADQHRAPDEVLASLREQGIDVIRVCYSDMIGVDRGRDVLIDEFPAALEHGLPFCRAIFHTSPQ